MNAALRRQSPRGGETVWRRAETRSASVITLVLTLLLAGCNSQVDSFDVPDVRTPIVSPTGVFFGRTTFQSNPLEIETTALIDVNNRLLLIADDNSFLVSGLYETTGRGFTAQARFHTDVGDEGSLIEPVAADFVGTFEPEAELTGTYIRADGEAGSTNLSYQLQTLRGSRLPNLEGDWVEPDPFGDNLTAFSFTGDGSFFGMDRNDCNYINARASLIDTRFNVYRVQFNRSCVGDLVAQPFSGLLTQLETVVGGRTTLQLVIGASNSEDAVIFRLIPAS
ncbi:MAG: hypothetical protein ACT4QA_07270 [Panacagrimonas sp.]